MSQPATDSAPHSLPAEANLEMVLAAWSEATQRLQRTHETLRNEVRRLTRELEIKNRELARKNRLADLGQMASHVAHEVRNSLVPITLYLSLLRRRLQHDPQAAEIVHKVESAFAALEATVSDLLQFAASPQPVLQPFAVRPLVEEVLQSLAPQMEAQGIRICLDIPQEQQVTADRSMLRRALLNLLLNALDAMPSGGELVVTAWQDGDHYELEVADSGAGFDAEASEKLFEPFFTTKSHGLGLGLAIVGRIAELHGGHVRACRCPEGGAAFILRLPQPRRKAAA